MRLVVVVGHVCPLRALNMVPHRLQVASACEGIGGDGRSICFEVRLGWSGVCVCGGGGDDVDDDDVRNYIKQ